MAFVSVIQPSAPRLYSAVIFTALTIAHDLFFRHAVDLNYYLSAALVDLLIVALTSTVIPAPKMLQSLHKICLFSVILNLIGWIMYMLYLEPAAYDAAFTLIYVYAIWVMFKKDRCDVGNYSLDSWTACFCLDRYKNVFHSISAKIKKF